MGSKANTSECTAPVTTKTFAVTAIDKKAQELLEIIGDIINHIGGAEDHQKQISSVSKDIDDLLIEEAVCTLHRAIIELASLSRSHRLDSTPSGGDRSLSGLDDSTGINTSIVQPVVAAWSLIAADILPATKQRDVNVQTPGSTQTATTPRVHAAIALRGLCLLTRSTMS